MAEVSPSDIYLGAFLTSPLWLLPNYIVVIIAIGKSARKEVRQIAKEYSEVLADVWVETGASGASAGDDGHAWNVECRYFLNCVVAPRLSWLKRRWLAGRGRRDAAEIVAEIIRHHVEARGGGVRGATPPSELRTDVTRWRTRISEPAMAGTAMRLSPTTTVSPPPRPSAEHNRPAAYAAPKPPAGEHPAEEARPSGVIAPGDIEDSCTEILRRHGWAVAPKPAGTEHGGAIVAKKHPHLVVLQCQAGNLPIGEAEIRAAEARRAAVAAGRAAVVGNTGYAASARNLATELGVLLLREADLPDLEQLCADASIV